MRRRLGALVCFFRGCPLALWDDPTHWIWRCPRCGYQVWHRKWEERGL